MRTTAKSPAVISFWPGTVFGLPLISSWSLPKATIEPEKLSEPTTEQKRIEMMILVEMSPGPPMESW